MSNRPPCHRNPPLSTSINAEGALRAGVNLLGTLIRFSPVGCPLVADERQYLHLVALLSLTLLRVRTRLALLSLNRVKHDLVRVILLASLVSLAPVVAYGISKDSTARVECGCCDAATYSGVALQSMLRVLVPEMESAIATSGAECTVLWVERDIIDRVDIGDVALRRVTVTLEGEIASRILLLDVLNRAATFNGTNSETRRIRKAAHDTSLPLEWALQGLIELERVGKVDDINVSVCGSDDK